MKHAIDSPRGRRLYAQRMAMASPWQPTGLAVDGRRRVIVSDPVNGRLDFFSLRGRWIGTLPIEAGASHLAVDYHDRVYVVVEAAHHAPVPAAAAVVTLEIDGGSAGYHWHTLQLSPLDPSARIAAGPHALTTGISRGISQINRSYQRSC